MTKRVLKNKWIIRRHTSDIDILLTTALYLKTFSKSSFESEDRKKLLLKLKKEGKYKERNTDIPTDKIDHLIKTLAFFMFGYISKISNKKTFLFSPLGNLLIKFKDDIKKREKIFLTMFWGMQFPHPESKTDSKFQLYPFRLIFKLLHEKKLAGYLYAFEIACSIVVTPNLQGKSYKDLVQNILKFRNMNDKKIKAFVKKDEHLYVNATYEWDYYMTKVLEKCGLLIREKGPTICKLHQGKETKRKLTRNKFTFNPELNTLYNSLELAYPFNSSPVALNDESRLQIDAIKEIFNFFPRELLNEIGIISNKKTDPLIALLELPKLIKLYANNTDGKQTGLFEKILTDGFNFFFNVDAEWKGGAGNTDIECLYTADSGNKTFAVDAKSSKNKLTGILVGRLRKHREDIGGEYTIVVAPKYVPAVKEDIKKTECVLLLASTFSEYLYNNISNDVRKIDFAPIDQIIVNSLGKDISAQVSQLTLDTFGHLADEDA